MKLTVDRIIDAGMATYAEVGYHGLSMRRVADRLDAQAGSLYYHVRNKSALVQLMAGRVAGRAYAAGSAALADLPDGAVWQERVEAQIGALRRSIQEHTGGAVLLAESPNLLSADALSLMERLQQTLHDAGVPAEHRGVAADTLLSYATGFVLQEQSTAAAPPTPDDAERLRARFPLSLERIGQSDDEQFLASVRIVCAGIAATIVGGHPTTGQSRPARSSPAS